MGAQLPAEPWAAEDSLVSNQPYSLRQNHLRRPSASSIIEAPPALDEDSSVSLPVDTEFEGSIASDRFAQEPDRSATPHACESNYARRSTNPISQFSFDADPSTYIPGADFDTHAPHSTEGTCSSPEPSFPPTPQLTANTQPFLDRQYSPLFSRQPRTSIYEDLSATLEYDYLHAISQLGSSPPPLDAMFSLPLEEDSGCDFEPGTSAQTIRRLAQAPSTSSFRSSLGESRAAEGLSHMDALPLSPITLRSASGECSRISSTSSDYDDGVDFLTMYSDSSDEEEFLTAPLSRSTSPVAPPSFPDGNVLHGLSYDEQLSESSGVDITARLSRLSCSSQSGVGSSRYVSAQEHVDSADDDYRSGRSQSRHGESSRQGESSRGQGNYSNYGSSSKSNQGFGGGSGGGRRDRDDDDDRYRRHLPRNTAPAYTESDTSESEEDEDDTPRRAKSGRQLRHISSSSADDDVPLAQQIPTALKAQRTIRRQVRDEMVERRRAKSLRRPQTSDRPPLSPPQRAAPELSLPSQSSRVPSISRGAAQPDPPKPAGRPRTRTLPSQPSSPFSVNELTKKLLGVQSSVPPLPVSQPVSPLRPSQDAPVPLSPKLPANRLQNALEHTAIQPRQPAQDSSTLRRLRSMRSFHRPRTTGGEPDLPPPVPSGGAQLGRSITSATRRPAESQPPPSLAQNSMPIREGGRSSLERARSTRSQSRRPSVDRDRSARPSLDQESRPPMPPLPSVEVVSSRVVKAWQQRFFVGSLQRFQQVEITSSSTPRDVLEILQSQGLLDDGSATGWMIWEVSQDFGMGTFPRCKQLGVVMLTCCYCAERPIRSFEILSDVCNSWVADKTVNILMAKKTPLAAKLSRGVSVHAIFSW